MDKSYVVNQKKIAVKYKPCESKYIVRDSHVCNKFQDKNLRMMNSKFRIVVTSSEMREENR